MFKNKVTLFVFIMLTSLLLGRITIFYLAEAPIMNESVWYNIFKIGVEIFINMKFVIDITILLSFKLIEDKKGYKRIEYDELGKVVDILFHVFITFYMTMYFVYVYSEKVSLGSILMLLNLSFFIVIMINNRIYKNEEEIFIAQKNLTISYVEMLSIRRINSSMVNIITIKGNYEIMCNDKCMKYIKEKIDEFGVLNQKHVLEI